MRETAEKGDKRTPKPAFRFTHAGNGKGEKRDLVFSLERSLLLILTW